MGVRGLASFIKENRQSLCHSIHFDASSAAQQGRVPVVVDAWGIIFQLYLDSLPWTSGGEYLRFYRLVRRLIIAWRDVGLEPTFVFDGASPVEKHDTTISRLQQSVTTARLFYTTSTASRSSPSFSRGNTILPAFASQTFIYALTSLDVATHFVPKGEADGVCVSIADSLGAFVLGLDSDFPILIAASKGGVKGYCPLDMMMWIEGQASDIVASYPKSGAGWSTTQSSRRGNNQTRQSSFLPPSNLISPKLVLTSIHPQALRQRLRLPATILPLFASLCGNDYTPPLAAEMFFEPNLSAVQRVEKVARILREQIFSPSASKGGNAGDQAVELVTRVVRKLACRPFLTEQEMLDLVEAIIEATMQYTLPPNGECCALYPFCGELEEEGCQTNETSSALVLGPATGKFAAAQRRGILGSVTHAFLYPERVYLWSILEDPSASSLKANLVLRTVRRRAWELAEEGLGRLMWSGPSEQELEDKGLMELLGGQDDEEGSSSGSASTTLIGNEAGESKIDEVQSLKRTIIEYVRQASSTRIAGVEVPLGPQPDVTLTPMCLQPIDMRLRQYLVVLQSDVPSIHALPPHLHPLVACVRLCLIVAASTIAKTDAPKWRRRELEAVLRGGLGNYSAWYREVDPKAKKVSENGLSWPLLTNRNSALVAQLTGVMTDSHLLAQSLLLTPDLPPTATHKSKREHVHPITHLTPFMFFSGITLHTLLSGDIPPESEWKWSEREDLLLERCLEAVVEGLDRDEVVVGWTTSPKPGMTGMMERLQIGPKAESGNKARNKTGRNVEEKQMGAVGKGRFDLLNGIMP
ncbi:hypothetical protein BCR39DRAFT_488877 [Naematelia encephala]|uniref:Asteroid domain-containing protein n=1 Tax=Naematelia encephala TaxID=71784 RepID=A0A1Y2ADS9_9TREE|nr:hypothetical protein BCR39DRAFT_488877 [Naematelia encephala]